MLIHHILDGLDADVVEVRRKLLRQEGIPTLLADLAGATSELHNLSHDMHILSEYYADIEAKVEFLTGAYNSYRDSGWAQTTKATIRQDLGHLEAMKWRTSVSKRWIVDYKNRVNIKINHVSCFFYTLHSFASSLLTLMHRCSRCPTRNKPWLRRLLPRKQPRRALRWGPLQPSHSSFCLQCLFV